MCLFVYRVSRQTVCLKRYGGGGGGGLALYVSQMVCGHVDDQNDDDSSSGEVNVFIERITVAHLAGPSASVVWGTCHG